MQNLLQQDLGSTMLSFAIILGWLGIGIDSLRVLAIIIKKILETIFPNSN